MTKLTQRSRRTWLAGAAVCAALVLSSCGADDDPMDEPTGADNAAAAAVPTDEPTDDGMDDADDADEADEADDGADDAGGDADEAEPGVYRAYSEDAVADPAFDTTIVFFHASWCPECRAFEQAIEAGPIPDGVQILKADYDTETDLKRRYDVSIQTTFVKVDGNGEELSSWVGYQKDRSVDTILDELG